MQNPNRWEPTLNTVELELTSFCNLGCLHCSRSCGHVSDKRYLTLGQIEEFFAQAEALNWTFNLVKLLGGEPALHPRIDDVLSLLYRIRGKSKSPFDLRIFSNGNGKKVVDKLWELYRRGLYVNNQMKADNRSTAHYTYNVAPIDLPEYAGCDFLGGCHMLNECGMALTYHGIYGCAAGASVDRIFGMNVGIQRLSDVTRELLAQIRNLCSHCGIYKSNFGDKMVFGDERVSPSWQRAYEQFRKSPPELTMFNEKRVLP